MTPISGARTALALSTALLFALGSGIASAQVRAQIRHNLSAQQNAQTLSYEEEVLSLVLEKSASRHGPYELVRAASSSQNRALRELSTGGLDVVSTMTSTDREAEALPIRYCLYRGLLGIRIGMGLPETAQRAESVADARDLQALVLGSVFDWPDRDIWQRGGLRVVRLNDFGSGLARLRLGSFDLLPLGVVDAGPIAAEQRLATVQGWALAYPTAYYFFVSRNNPALAQRLTDGFEAALRDGSFEQLFNRRIEPLLRAAHVLNRKVFILENPHLPAATPLQRRELWHPVLTQIFPDVYREAPRRPGAGASSARP